MRVLLVGNTGYITKEFVQEAFPESEVFIMGNSLLKTERKKHLNVRPFPERDEELEDIFHTYDFELMVYFSNYTTLFLFCHKKHILIYISIYLFYMIETHKFNKHAYNCLANLFQMFYHRINN